MIFARRMQFPAYVLLACWGCGGDTSQPTHATASATTSASATTTASSTASPQSTISASASARASSGTTKVADTPPWPDTPLLGFAQSVSELVLAVLRGEKVHLPDPLFISGGSPKVEGLQAAESSPKTLGFFMRAVVNFPGKKGIDLNIVLGPDGVRVHKAFEQAHHDGFSREQAPWLADTLDPLMDLLAEGKPLPALDSMHCTIDSDACRALINTSIIDDKPLKAIAGRAGPRTYEVRSLAVIVRSTSGDSLMVELDPNMDVEKGIVILSTQPLLKVTKLTRGSTR